MPLARRRTPGQALRGAIRSRARAAQDACAMAPAAERRHQYGSRGQLRPASGHGYRRLPAEQTTWRHRPAWPARATPPSPTSHTTLPCNRRERVLRDPIRNGHDGDLHDANHDARKPARRSSARALCNAHDGRSTPRPRAKARRSPRRRPSSGRTSQDPVPVHRQIYRSFHLPTRVGRPITSLRFRAPSPSSPSTAGLPTRGSTPSRLPARPSMPGSFESTSAEPSTAEGS